MVLDTKHVPINVSCNHGNYNTCDVHFLFQGMHKCDECSYIASSKTNLERHMVNHRQSSPVRCLYCSFSSTGEAAIQRHMAEHHDQSEIPIAARRPPQPHSDMEDSPDEGMCDILWSIGCSCWCCNRHFRIT